MNYDDPALRERLAADYALGSLRGAARRRMERLIETDPAMAAAAETWLARLNTLSEALPEIEPPPRVWTAIERHLALAEPSFDADIMPFPAPATVSTWKRVGVWRGLTAAAMAVAASLAIYIAVRPASTVSEQLPVAVLNDASGHAAFVATAGRNARSINLTRLTESRAASDHDYQLWLLPKGGKPRPLGLVPPLRHAAFQLSGDDAAALGSADGVAISLEPAGGSPTGQPTGPILFNGAVIAAQ